SWQQLADASTDWRLAIFPTRLNHRSTSVPTIESTEWTFAADAAKWMSLFLHSQAKSPFADAKVEQRGAGSAKRSDLVLHDRDGAGSTVPPEIGIVPLQPDELPVPGSGRAPPNQADVQEGFEPMDARAGLVDFRRSGNFAG